MEERIKEKENQRKREDERKRTNERKRIKGGERVRLRRVEEEDLHDLDERTFLRGIQGRLVFAGFFNQQIGHALPILNTKSIE